MCAIGHGRNDSNPVGAEATGFTPLVPTCRDPPRAPDILRITFQTGILTPGVDHVLDEGIRHTLFSAIALRQAEHDGRLGT